MNNETETAKKISLVVCLGSSCHIKGSKDVIDGLMKEINGRGVGSRIDFKGAFCFGNCENGVCVSLNGRMFSVKPETTEEFFQNEILPLLN